MASQDLAQDVRPPVPHEQVEATADYGGEAVDLRKLGMWIFLSSEVIFFGSLIIMFLVYAARSRALGITDAEHLDITITGIITFILLSSSLTMVLALHGIQTDNLRAGKLWLLATIILGSAFVGVQIYEYTQLVHHGVTIGGSLFGSAFYTLTGFHGTHVFIGVIMLVITLIMAQVGKFGAHNYLPVEMVGLYWHFVDLVWLVIFTLVYLI